MAILYYLLYKLCTSDDLWIVKAAEEYDYLLQHIHNFESSTEIYFILERQIHINKIENELTRQHFRLFYLSKYDTLLYETLLYET